ncbi:MAG: methyltransferase domain-containing protein [Planctomycetaceae bacterium]|nr:methyltransferase domain-containing protein [Planctomycetaceae bacterium]
MARVYDLLSESAEQPMRDLGLKMLDASSGQRILEIGFGTGHCVVTLAEAVGPDGQVFGIDLSDKMLEEAQKLCDQKGVAARVNLTQGDASHLPYEDESMDGLFMSFTLELFDTPEIPAILQECRRVLKPGGRLVNVSVSKEGAQGVAVKAYEWLHQHFPNLMDCRPIHAGKAIENAGFTIEQSNIDHMWVPVEIVSARKPS